MTGIINEKNVVSPKPAMSGNTDFGLQAGPSTNVGGITMAMHPSFIVETWPARRGAPLFYNSNGPSKIATSATLGAPRSP